MLLLPVSSKIGSKREMVTTKDFQIHISNSVIVLTNSCNSVSVENFLNDFSSLLDVAEESHQTKFPNLL